MPNRITIYGKFGEGNTKRIQRDLGSMALTYNFYDVTKQPQQVSRLIELGATTDVYPKVEIACNYAPGSVFLTNPDTETLMQTLYAEEVLGVTSYWV
jgi:hypothetical protein